MCGIFGMTFLQGVERDAEMMNKIRFVFDEILTNTQNRGEHATGIASFKRDGNYELFKKNINADTMTRENEEYRRIVNNFDANETSVVISHTRFYTKGLPSNNLNNHPFDVGNVIGLHNGSVKNDDWLFSKYTNHFKRIGEVDSEIIFQLINHYNKDDISLAGLKKALEDTYIRGLFALAFVHKNNSNMLHLIKQEKPMYIAYWQEAGIVLFNSDDDYIMNAFHTLERVGHSFGTKNVKQSVEIKKVYDDNYFTVNANATTLEDALSEPVKFYISSSNYTYAKTGGASITTTTSTTTTTTTKREKVTATDSKGLVLQGEIDTATGEVIIWSSDNVTNADDGNGLNDEESFTCFECGEIMTEEDLNASFNDSNPKDQSICTSCYTEIMEELMKEKNEVTVEVFDCDGNKVVG